VFLTVVLGIINLVVSALGTYGLRLPGFDITPIGVIMIAYRGENILVGSIVLTIAYMLPSPGRFSWVWLQIPAAWLIGWLSVQYSMLIIPILIYHAISVLVGILTGTLNGRYIMYTVINLGLNVVIARFYGMTM